MKNRLSKLDEIRGYTLISMILYHFMWDLKYLAGFKMDWYVGIIGTVWQQSICISFILISGFSFSLGKKHFKRSMTVFLAGVIVSVVTLLFMPENRIVFGILTFMGSAGLLMIPINKLHSELEKKLDAKTLNITMIIWSFLLFIVFYNVNEAYINVLLKQIRIGKYMYDGYVMTYLGFTDPMFYSTDYFSIIPWIFMYLCGFYLYRITCVGKSTDYKQYLVREHSKQIAFIGRNTLIIYMLHQPVLYLITLLIQHFILFHI